MKENESRNGAFLRPRILPFTNSPKVGAFRRFAIYTKSLTQSVQTRFYGYSIQRDGIYEQDNLTAEAIKGLDGRGCYVYVKVKDGKITIKQDLNDCWGIYLFRQGNYFALSNSFFRLLDHIKFRYPLTVNRDYCNFFWSTACAVMLILKPLSMK